MTFDLRNTNVLIIVTIHHHHHHHHSLEGLRANYEFTPWAKRTAFTRSAITSPKVNRLGRNLENCELNVWGWPWQTLGAIRAVATV